MKQCICNYCNLETISTLYVLYSCYNIEYFLNIQTLHYLNFPGLKSFKALDVQQVHPVEKDVFSRPESLKRTTAVPQRNVSLGLLFLQNFTTLGTKRLLFGFPSVLISVGWSAGKNVARQNTTILQCRVRTDSHLRSSPPMKIPVSGPNYLCRDV